MIHRLPPNGWSRPAMSQSAMTALVNGIAADPQRWQPLVDYTVERRWWHRLHQTPDVDVWLLSWLQDQGTQLHDHGDSRAFFTVVAGELTEVRASRAGGISAKQLSVGASRWVPVRAVHDVTNEHPTPAVSIHAYSPPLSRMTFYDRVGGRLQVSGVEWTDQGERGERPQERSQELVL